MSTGTLTLGDHVRRMEEGRPSSWCSLWERPGARRTMQMTSCADALVTDSAAAAAGWGCGFSCNTGVLNITPDGRQHLPILVHAKQNGRATGVVTTTRVTHATPAGFCANSPHRDLEDDIARQQIERGLDVIMGGGARHFPDTVLDRRDGHEVVRTADALFEKVGSPRLIGLFSRDHIPYVLDRTGDIPSLGEMAIAAIRSLESAPGGFVLQVEGGRVDHAAHDNDAPSLVREQIEFDRALGDVLDWMDGRDDTLLVVTTDHGNANPGLTFYGKRGEQGLRRLLKAERSFEWIFARISQGRKDGDLSRVAAQAVEAATGVALDQEGLNLFVASLESRRVMPFRQANTPTSVLGSLLATVYGVAFTSPNHTSDMVELTTLGPGSERFAPLMRVPEVWTAVTQAMGFAPPQPLEGMDRVIGLKRIEGD
ncbi:MAG: alkaline phosphatase [Phycisphaeraceae bacterium]|nr:alkaline phosphatase [Phycisphaerae bacterium]MBX3392195.1 alkaline phosphatase [Phycisphaeraceae bacterium]